MPFLSNLLKNPDITYPLRVMCAVIYFVVTYMCIYRPGPIRALDAFRITAVSCGHTHSVAVDNNGMLFSWGDNSRGQLGSNTHTDKKLFPM